MQDKAMETIAAAEDTSLENATPTNQEENVQENAAAPEEGQAEYGIPKKFVGKSIEEISRSYAELEKLKGRLDSERSTYKSELETLREKYAALEEERKATYQQQPQQHYSQATQQTEEDPLSDFDTSFDADPKEAIKHLGKKLLGKTAEAQAQALRMAQAQQAHDYFTQQQRDNPDFRELIPEMQRLAQKYYTWLSPEVRDSKGAIEILYKIARAENEQKFVSRAVETAKKSSELVREEKRKAFSESSNSQGDSSVSVDDLSVEELARLLPRSGPKY
jgi:hypothetical protein